MGLRFKKSGVLLSLALWAAGLLAIPSPALADHSVSRGHISVRLSDSSLSTAAVYAQSAEGAEFKLNFNSSNRRYESSNIPSGDNNVGSCGEKTYIYVVQVYKSTSKTGGPIGESGELEVCDGVTDPSTNITVTVMSEEEQASNGSIKVTAKAVFPDGDSQNCGSSSELFIKGPTNKSNIYLTKSGSREVGGLQPGTYSVEVECVYTAEAGSTPKTVEMQRKNVIVKAGTTTTIALTSDDQVGEGSIKKEGEANEDDCQPPSFGWLICPAINLTIGAIDKMETGVITPFLRTSPLSTAKGDPIYNLWKAFRSVANVGFVLVFLVIIFASSLSISIDAYTIKKMLPRLVVAAIAVQFSFLLASLAIDITNVLGHGIMNLIDAVLPAKWDFSGVGNSLGGGLGLGALGLAGGVAIVGSFLTGSLLLFLIGAFFGVLAVFMTIIFRKILITLLVVLSPIAFVLWVLPNTEGAFKLWSKTLMKTLMMYPLIIMLIGAGKIFSVAAGATDTDLSFLFALAGLVVPLFMIPATFKLAGAGMIAAGGLFQRLGKTGKDMAQGSGWHGRLKDWSQGRKAQLADGRGVNMFGANVGSGKRVQNKLMRSTEMRSQRQGVEEWLKAGGVPEKQAKRKAKEWSRDQARKQIHGDPEVRRNLMQGQRGAMQSWLEAGGGGH